MTVKEYISSKIRKFGIFKVSDSDLLDICEKTGMDADKQATEYTVREREIAFLNYVPEMLLFIDSINEKGFAVSRTDTINKVKAYYSFKCNELGVEDKLTQKTVIRNASNRW